MSLINPKQLGNWSKNLVFNNAGTYKIEGLATGTNGNDAVNLNQLNALVSFGGNMHLAADVATTAAIVIASTFAGDTIDGVLLVIGNRFLVKNQVTTSENGIYEVTSGGLVRAADSDGTPSASEVIAGDTVAILTGTENAGKAFTLLGTAGVPIVVGVGAQVWTLFSVNTIYAFSNGLTQTGADVKLGGAFTENTTWSGAFTANFGTSNSRISGLTAYTTSGITLNTLNGAGANVASITETVATFKYDNASVLTGFRATVNTAELKYTSNVSGYVNTINVNGDSIISRVDDVNNGIFSTLTQDSGLFNFSSGIQVGNITATAANGMIRYNAGDLEGYVSGSWVSLTAGAGLTAGTAITIASDNSINVDYDNVTITLDIAGNIQVGTIQTSNINNFATAVKDTVITSSIFLNTGNVDFTIVNGVSVVGNLGSNSVGDAELKSTNVGSIGQVVTLGNSAGDFTYVDAAVTRVDHRAMGLVENSSAGAEALILATPFATYVPLANSIPYYTMNGIAYPITSDGTGAVYCSADGGLDGGGSVTAINALTSSDSLYFEPDNAGFDTDSATDYGVLTWVAAS